MSQLSLTVIEVIVGVALFFVFNGWISITVYGYYKCNNQDTQRIVKQISKVYAIVLIAVIPSLSFMVAFAFNDYLVGLRLYGLLIVLSLIGNPVGLIPLWLRYTKEKNNEKKGS